MRLPRLFAWISTRTQLSDGSSRLHTEWDSYLDHRGRPEKLLRYHRSWGPFELTPQEDCRRTPSRSHPQISEGWLPGRLALARNVEWSASRRCPLASHNVANFGHLFLMGAEVLEEED